MISSNNIRSSANLPMKKLFILFISSHITLKKSRLSSLKSGPPTTAPPSNELAIGGCIASEIRSDTCDVSGVYSFAKVLLEDLSVNSTI